MCGIDVAFGFWVEKVEKEAGCPDLQFGEFSVSTPNFLKEIGLEGNRGENPGVFCLGSLNLAGRIRIMKFF